MIYQSMSGDAEGSGGTITLTNGSLSQVAGPLLYVTNSTGTFNLTNVSLTASSGVLAQAAADQWGTSGSNGGVMVINATNQKLVGNVVADSISTITINLKSGSSLSGTINGEKSAKAITINLEGGSLSLTGNSYVTVLSSVKISGSTVTNITGNGHNLYYQSSSNSSLGGKTYSLTGGGQLIPY